MASVNHVSSIATALQGKTGSLDIPKPRTTGEIFGKESFAAVVAKGCNAPTGLPTPPNSISPNLPPHSLKAKAAHDPNAHSPPAHVDSDIDLLDAMDHAKAQDQPHHVFAVSTGDLGSVEGPDNITPAVLAKHHLPDILLGQGPIAIRHVMNHLALSVPSFSDIPPAKARRLVVGALENRSGGGVRGDVEFEKVGWGRWNARIRGQPSREARAMYSIKEGNYSPPESAPSSFTPSGALVIPNWTGSRSKPRRQSHSSWTGESMSSSHSGRGDRMDTDMAEHEADRMSLDEEPASRPIRIQRPRNRQTAEQQFISDTDSEDWEAMGVNALRQNSYSKSTGSTGGVRPSITLTSRRSSRPFMSPIPRSTSATHAFNHFDRHTNGASHSLDFSGVVADSQEREAIEALMKMGSM